MNNQYFNNNHLSSNFYGWPFTKKTTIFSIFSIALAYFVLLRPLAGFLTVADTPKHSEAIVVLGEGWLFHESSML
ncbi:MAG: hypothetical protein KGJ87_08940 [Planctomycetota bacterium]|nr:hypothetical protein [Planctomycetota bacterium]MDE2217267.1 hypothetical protein [Planctomycetota bacterium]